jgi:hypothetical protein
VSRLATGNEQQRITAAHTLAHLLETEEARYRALVGDPHANPNLRTHYTVGKVLSVLNVSRNTRHSCTCGWCRSAAARLATWQGAEGARVEATGAATNPTATAAVTLLVLCINRDVNSSSVLLATTLLASRDPVSLAVIGRVSAMHTQCIKSQLSLIPHLSTAHLHSCCIPAADT